MNIIFVALILIAYCSCAWQQLFHASSGDEMSHPMQLLTNNMLATSNDAITLAIGLIGVLSLFLGVMKVAEEAGLLQIIAKFLQPLLSRLFPDVPKNHPAMGAMVMNLSANMLGLGNAATPFGIKAMQELNKINTTPHTASDAMILFLAINTSSVTIIPTKVIALRAAAGSIDPAGIIPTTLFATVCSTIVAIAMAKLFQKIWSRKNKLNLSNSSNISEQNIQNNLELENIKSYPFWVSLIGIAGFFSLIPIAILGGTTVTPWILPSCILFILLFGFIKKINVYDNFVLGAKEGFEVAIRIIPYILAILVAIAMFRASGGLDVVTNFLGKFTAPLGLPGEALPMALIRPLSGSGSLGVLADTINNPNIGPDSYVGYLVSTIMGSTETTFYVLAVYFGAVQIKRIRYALPVALIADAAAVAASIFIVTALHG